MSLRRCSHHFASTMLSTMLLMAAVASFGVVTANPRPNDVFGTTIDEEPPKHQGSLADQKPLSSGTSQRDACSLDDYLATLTLSDMEKVIERYAKLQGMTVSGLIKQLYSTLYSSIKRKVVTNERLSPMALEAMQELCVSGLGPAYQVGPIGGPLASGMPGVSGFLLPNTEFAPLPPLRTLRPPPGARLVIQAGGLNDVQLPEASIVVSPQMTLLEALRRADYKLAADTGLGEGVLQLGFSATRACYIVEAVAGLKATPDRAWKIAINDRFGKLVFEDVCLPGRDDLVVHPKMTITLTYSDVKRTAV
ncbi:unnamed protein product [Ixodes persulcatus]